MEERETSSSYDIPPPNDPSAHTKCLMRLHKSVKSSSPVKHMLISMQEIGFPVKLSRDFSCEPCSPKVAGSFDPFRQQVVLCQNNIYSQIHMNQVLAHELVHSYDDKTVNMNWYDLRHLACTEIRAANLSRECSFARENLVMFNFGLKAHNKECVKNRAALSITSVREDLCYENARELVDSVFEQCYNYTRPFQGIPPLTLMKPMVRGVSNFLNREHPDYYED